MKNITIILISALVALTACTKSKVVHPEIGDGNDEIMTVGIKDVHVKYTRTDHAELQKLVFHYSLAEAQQFIAAEMTKQGTFFELTLNNLLSDTLYCYYYELFPKGGSAFLSGQKTFRMQAFDQPPTPPVSELPTVVTAEASEITENSAVCGGEVTNDGGTEVTDLGICWSTSENPSLGNSHVVTANGIGTFEITITGLSASTTYHVRAYATNEVGTAYGLDKEFTTFEGGGGSDDAPIGAINGLFTINESGDEVYFSQGNLQYQASTNTWRFADNQWDYVGEANTNVSSTYDGWIDLFGWGTSGYSHGSDAYQPWNTSILESAYYAYGNWQNNFYDGNGQADWGYNSISNGGNTTHQWRTLTGGWEVSGEWYYVFHMRSTPSGIRYAMAQVNGVNGVILLPDNWDPSIYTLSNANQGGASFSSNVLFSSQWNTLQNAGAVFLPAAGTRYRTSVFDFGSNGGYWSASCGDSLSAYLVYFYDGGLNVRYSLNRCYGLSVRLVCPAV